MYHGHHSLSLGIVSRCCRSDDLEWRVHTSLLSLGCTFLLLTIIFFYRLLITLPFHLFIHPLFLLLYSLPYRFIFLFTPSSTYFTSVTSLTPRSLFFTVCKRRQGVVPPFPLVWKGGEFFRTHAPTAIRIITVADFYTNILITRLRERCIINIHISIISVRKASL